MRVNFRNGLSRKFPIIAFELEDVLDRLGTTDSVIDFRISEYENMDLPKRLCRGFTADIYSLNLFVQRYENLENAELAAMKSLLKSNPEGSFEDILLMTYGLDSVMVYPCKDCRELGETVIENEMLPELEDCSDEMLELLDREHIGQIMCERDGGMFVDGYYCVTSGYELPDIHFEFGEPERCFFRLLIAPDAQKMAQARWISLPCDSETLLAVYDQTCCELQSSLPWIMPDSLENMHQIGILNALAERLSELSHDEFVKLKAIMESENICEIFNTVDCIEHLSAYEFDRSVQDCSTFGQAYLARNLPTNFDISVLESENFYDLGSEILERIGGEATAYGAVSGRGQSLYAAITVQPEQRLAEDFSEDESQEFRMELGGMCF